MDSLRDSESTAARVEPATSADLPAVRLAYADGRVIQREQGSAVWPYFTGAAILNEIEPGLLCRVTAGDVLAAVFSVAYEDSAIWAHKECVALGRDGLRMDTWAANAALVTYYQRLGFELVGTRCIVADRRACKWHSATYAPNVHSWGGSSAQS